MLIDFRYALRQLIKSPGFTLVAILTLALGIGANSAIFSVIEAVLLRPLPYPEPTQLYQFSETRPDLGEMSIAYPNYLDWRATQRCFADLSVYRRDDFNLSGIGDPETLHGAFVTSSYFQVMGLAPIFGARLFRTRRPGRRLRCDRFERSSVARKARRRSERGGRNRRLEWHFL